MKKSKVAKMESDPPRTPPEAMAPKKQEPSEEDLDREAEYHLDDMLRVEKIKNDPAKMERVRKAAERKHHAIRSIADLKVAGQALAAEKREALKKKA